VELQELQLSTLGHITRNTLPGGLPTSLRALQCHIDVLDPALLSTLTNMQRLEIEGDDLNHFCLEGGAGGDALLRAMAQLQQLEDLWLSGLECEWPPMSIDHPALTASSSLTRLHLSTSSPPAWEHVFPPGRVLQSITINGDYPVSQLQAAVKQLVACCPKLQDLCLHCTLSPMVDMAMLGQLSALTALNANYSSVSDVGEACQVLHQFACLTRLADLNLSFSCSKTLEVSALLPLTALRQLTHLKCTRPFPATEARPYGVCLNLWSDPPWASEWIGNNNDLVSGLVSVLSKQPTSVAPQGTDMGPSLPATATTARHRMPQTQAMPQPWHGDTKYAL